MSRDEKLDSACLFSWHILSQSSQLCTNLAYISSSAFPHFHLVFADLVYYTRESGGVFQLNIWRAEHSEERGSRVSLLLLEYSWLMHKGFSQAPTGICCALLCRLKRAKLVAKNRSRNCNLLWLPVVNSDFGKRVFFLKGLILNASLACPRPVETPRGVVKTSLLLYFPSPVTPYCPRSYT